MKTIKKWLPVLGAITVAIAAAPATMTCNLTGQEVKGACCCEMKDGKVFCTLAKKTVEKCCCKGM